MTHLPCFYFFFFNATPTTEIYTLSLHDALPIYAKRNDCGYRCLDKFRSISRRVKQEIAGCRLRRRIQIHLSARSSRSEEHTSELQSHHDLVCRLLLEKKKNKKKIKA